MFDDFPSRSDLVKGFAVSKNKYVLFEKDELDAVIRWLTGYDESELADHLSAGTTFAGFFAGARLNPNADLITGVICGVRVETIEDPLMQQIRYLDKLVDELAKGRALEKVLRS